MLKAVEILYGEKNTFLLSSLVKFYNNLSPNSFILLAASILFSPFFITIGAESTVYFYPILFFKMEKKAKI